MSVTLNGWRQIAAFLQQSVKTAQNWERDGLPVHRVGEGRSATVFAFPSELAHWLRIKGGATRQLLENPRKKELEQNRELRSNLRKLAHQAQLKMTVVQERLASALLAAETSRRSQSVRLRMAVDETVADMGRKLVEAQEQERARIARELHDDICQRLALSSIALERIADETSAPAHLKDRIDEIRGELELAAADLNSLSRQLHASKLDLLGIVPTMKGMCRDLTERSNIEITFESAEVPAAVDPQAAVCLYRVLQESLRNAMKHGHAQRIHVQLRGTKRELHLVVKDWGTGFDIKTSRSSSGLGLTSMRERVRLEKGTLVVTSKPGTGTTVHACVPLLSLPCKASA